MNRKPATIVAALIGALLAPLMPATAATEIITPTSEITFDNNLAHSMRFDALGRAWIWNTVTDPITERRLAIFEKVSGSWARVQAVEAKKLSVKELRFDSDGKAYATNSRKKEIVTWQVADSGTVPKERRIALRGRSFPLDAFPNADGSLFVLHENRIDEFVLPLRRKERPVRTIRADFPSSSKLVALADGTVFVMQLGEAAPIEVYGSDQSGVSAPTRTILIDSALASWQYTTDIALTPNGQVAVVYWPSGVALFDTDASGNSETPSTWYPLDALLNVQGVDFRPNGVMGLAHYSPYLSSISVTVYFEE
jgi:WD40 repeat protein